MLRQIIKLVLCLPVAIGAVSMASPSAFAQLSPSMSPWMQMFDRPNNPMLGNYLGNVRPQQDMMKAYAAQANQIQSQQRALQALQAPGGSSETMGTRNLSSATAPTGGTSSMQAVLEPPRTIPSVQSPAGFNQYMHYYPPNSMPRRPVPNFSSTGRRR